MSRRGDHIRVQASGQRLADQVTGLARRSNESLDPALKVDLLKMAVGALSELKAIAAENGHRLPNLDEFQGSLDALHREYLAAGYYGVRIGAAG